ncbi:MAG TPA: glycosyltransferase family 4 protein [Candidatus Binataceae bacterium]|jgi:glycosyltransferase involved in cell wall biosynthesis|nr:glycosyltransferase family 4 protein [Candidatus Binataceae bacterium]
MKTAAGSGPLRIVGVDPELGFAGGESQVLGLTLELLTLGHGAELLCDPNGILWQRARAANVVCHPLRIRNALDCVAGMRLRRFLFRNRFDVVHFHTSRAHSMAPFAAGVAGALVVTRRMDYVPNRWFAPYLYNRAVDAVAAISQGVANALIAAGVAAEGITVIPSGVDCTRFAPPACDQRAAARRDLGLDSGQIAVASVGALELRKGHTYLLDALAGLQGRYPAIRAFIAGGGSQRAALEEQANRLKLGQSLRFLGSIGDPRTLFWAADIFVQPSMMEGLGVALLEAMACGLPVVASRAGGMVEVIEDRHDGLLVAVADSIALERSIEELAESPALRSSLAAQARVKAEQDFSLAAMARRTLALYQSSIRRKPRRCAA